MGRSFEGNIAILAGQLIGYWGLENRCSTIDKTPQKLLPNLLAAPIQPLIEIPLGVSASGLAHECWWQQLPSQLTDETVVVKQLQDLLQSAVHRQIQDLPAEPVGVFLSGGLDSSIAAALLVQIHLSRRL